MTLVARAEMWSSFEARLGSADKLELQRYLGTDVSVWNLVGANLGVRVRSLYLAMFCSYLVYYLL